MGFLGHGGNGQDPLCQGYRPDLHLLVAACAPAVVSLGTPLA